MKCNASKQKREDVSVFDTMPPTYPRRIVVATLHVVGPSLLDVIFSGNTLPVPDSIDFLAALRASVNHEFRHSRVLSVD